MIDLDAFVESVYAAFGDVEKPKKDDVIYHLCEDCEAIREVIGGIDSREVRDRDVQSFEVDIGALSPSAFHYYMPRLMEFTLRNPDTLAFDNLLSILSPVEVNYFYKNRFELFSKNQRETVIEYLSIRRTYPESEYEEELLERAEKIWS